MSLAIHTNDVTEVLLADGWHKVEGNSFDFDAYEYILDHHPKSYSLGDQDYQIVHAREGEVFPTSEGVQWCEKVRGKQITVSCPATSILAVRSEPGRLGDKGWKEVRERQERERETWDRVHAEQEVGA